MYALACGLFAADMAQKLTDGILASLPWIGVRITNELLILTLSTLQQCAQLVQGFDSPLTVILICAGQQNAARLWQHRCRVSQVTNCPELKVTASGLKADAPGIFRCFIAHRKTYVGQLLSDFLSLEGRHTLAS